MKLRTSQTLYAYWNELRAGRIAPRRLDVEPSRISSVLPETFMLERMDASTYRYRLAGTRLCEIFGFELRDTNLLEGWSTSDRNILARDLGSTCTYGGVTVLELEASTETARHMQLEAILLPLTHGDDIARVIGAMAPMTLQHWLGHERLVHKQLVRHEVVWPDGRPHVLIQRTASRSAAPTPLVTAPSPGRVEQLRRFRVLEGGRGKR